MIDLKKSNQNLKTIVAIGGANPDLEHIWESVASNPQTRRNFANNILNFLRRNNLDGVGE
jgi:GH18 family chitinase